MFSSTSSSCTNPTTTTTTLNYTFLISSVRCLYCILQMYGQNTYFVITQQSTLYYRNHILTSSSIIHLSKIVDCALACECVNFICSIHTIQVYSKYNGITISMRQLYFVSACIHFIYKVHCTFLHLQIHIAGNTDPAIMF